MMNNNYAVENLMKSNSFFPSHSDSLGNNSSHHFRKNESSSTLKKRKRCDDESVDSDSWSTADNSQFDLMRGALTLPQLPSDDSMFLSGSSSSIEQNPIQSNMQFSFHQITPFPLFESEDDMIFSASSSSSHKKNKLSPQSHLIEFIRDNVMQYLLFHLKIDTRQVNTDDEDQNMYEASTACSSSEIGQEQDVDITIPVGLLLDYIVQQAQRLYFNMYEYIRELASTPIQYQCKSKDQREVELSLACNEFEKMVIEQVHFLLSQIQSMRSGCHLSEQSIVPMLKKYDKILPKTFHTLRLVTSTSQGIGSYGDSFTVGIVDESFLFKSTVLPCHRQSSAQQFDDMKNNSALSNISSLILNSKINFSKFDKFLH